MNKEEIERLQKEVKAMPPGDHFVGTTAAPVGNVTATGAAISQAAKGAADLLSRQLIVYPLQASQVEFLARSFQDAIDRETAALKARVAELETKLTTILTDVNYKGGIQYWTAKHDETIAREGQVRANLDAARAEIATLRKAVTQSMEGWQVLAESEEGTGGMQDEVIRLGQCLARTSADYAHLTAVPKEELAELRKDRERLDWLETEPEYCHEDNIRAAIDAAMSADKQDKP